MPGGDPTRSGRNGVAGQRFSTVFFSPSSTVIQFFSNSARCSTSDGFRAPQQIRLREGHLGAALHRGEVERHRVVVLRLVGQASQRAEVREG